MGMKVAVKPVSFALAIKDSYLELLRSAAIVKEVSNEMVSSARKITRRLSFHQPGRAEGQWGLCDAGSCMTRYLL